MLLYISDRKSTICETLSERGFFLYSCPFETARFLCEKKDTGGVVLDCIPDLHAGEAICAELRRRYPAMPIAAIVPYNCSPDLEADKILRDTQREQLIAEIEDFFLTRCQWSAKALSTYALTLDFDTQTIRYMGYPLPLTPTEFRLLHCLFYRAPRPTDPDDLMSLCYFGKARSIKNIGVQIHKINQKAAKIDPRPLIVHEKDGYRLRDGIV